MLSMFSHLPFFRSIPCSIHRPFLKTLIVISIRVYHCCCRLLHLEWFLMWATRLLKANQTGQQTTEPCSCFATLSPIPQLCLRLRALLFLVVVIGAEDIQHRRVFTGTVDGSHDKHIDNQASIQANQSTLRQDGCLTFAWFKDRSGRL